MSLVEIPLNHYLYRFRKLNFEEEFALEPVPGEDVRKLVLAAAMVDVSGLAVDREQARTVIDALPKTVLSRVWVLYKTGLPEQKFFSTRGLYLAPEPSMIVRPQVEDDDRRSHVVDRAVEEMERWFGKEEVAEARELQERLIERVSGGQQPAPGADQRPFARDGN